MQYFIGIDDTDNLESRGTGNLARNLATALTQDFRVHGVTRHQLLEDERVPKTAKNSCAGIIFEGDSLSLGEIALYARKIMLADFQPGSDPGLCVASKVPTEIIAYGQRAQREFLHQQEARELAVVHGIFLEGLGGDEDGVIGALAAVGLLGSGSDGRYVQIGSIRSLEGLHPVETVLGTGITVVQTLDAKSITSGLILTDRLRPSRLNGKPILFVEWQEECWVPLKLD